MPGRLLESILGGLRDVLEVMLANVYGFAGTLCLATSLQAFGSLKIFPSTKNFVVIASRSCLHRHRKVERTSQLPPSDSSEFTQLLILSFEPRMKDRKHTDSSDKGHNR